MIPIGLGQIDSLHYKLDSEMSSLYDNKLVKLFTYYLKSSKTEFSCLGSYCYNSLPSVCVCVVLVLLPFLKI